MKIDKDYFEYKNNFLEYKHIKSILLYGEEEKNTPLITIAIPTYKRIDLLKQSLESCINQKQFINYDIIIIDNDDNFDNKECLELVKTLNCKRIKYYKNQKNIGMFGNWNRCIELAKGKYITILNDDDWFEENFLSKMMNNLEGDEDAIFCDYNIRDFRKKDKINLNSEIKEEKTNLIIEKLFFTNIIPGSLGAIFRKEKLEHLGGYNPIYYPTSDYILTSNFVYRYKCKRLNLKLTNYRIQENESLKAEIILKFLENDFIFRKYLIDLLIVPNYFNRFTKIIRNEQIKYYKNIWKIKLPLKEEKINFIDSLWHILYLEYQFFFNSGSNITRKKIVAFIWLAIKIFIKQCLYKIKFYTC